MADLLRVGVHEPGHFLLAGRHVGSRDVAFGPDHRNQLGRIAARDALALPGAELVGRAAHAALGAAVRETEEGAFPGHPHRQRGALTERDVRGEADSAFGRAHREGVLDAVAGERLHVVVVHPHREVDGQRASRREQPRPELGIEVERVSRPLELRRGDAVKLRVPLLAGRDRELLGVGDRRHNACSSGVRGRRGGRTAARRRGGTSSSGMAEPDQRVS